MAEGRLAGVTKVLVALLISPLIGFAVGFVMLRLMRVLLAAAGHAANTRLKSAQFATAAALAFAHGANDAQKSMGLLTLVLFLGGFLPAFAVPLWVIFACAAAMTLSGCVTSAACRVMRAGSRPCCCTQSAMVCWRRATSARRQPASW